MNETREELLMRQAAHTAEYYFGRAMEWAREHNIPEEEREIINTYVIASALDFLACTHIDRLDSLISTIDRISGEIKEKL